MRTLFCGTILTMAEPLYAEAVLVEDGIICDVGSAEELKNKYRDCEVIEFNGVMMPSFIDAHSHFTMTAAQSLQCDLSKARSLSDVKNAVRDFIEENGVQSGEWVVANSYDHTVFDGGVEPDISEIDAICPDKPLILRHRSNHMLQANSLALKIGGLTLDDAYENPANIVQRNGRLTGLLKEGAQGRVTRFIPEQTSEMIYSRYEKTAKRYAEHGITTVQDGYISKKTLDIYRLANSKGELPVDVVAYVGGSRNFNDVKKDFDSFNKLSSLSIGGIKALLDGSPQLRTAWVRKPYITENTCYRQAVSDEALVTAFKVAADNATQILVHCNGDAAIEQFLRCLDEAEKDKRELKHLKPVIIHAQLMGKDQIPKAKQLGAVISFFVAHCYHWGDVHIENLGAERGMNISPVGSALEAKVPFTFHQDTPVIDCDMLETVWCAVNRVTRNGVQLAKDERISVLDALRAVTVNAAYQYSQENVKGTVEKGKYADLVVLDDDPLTINPCDIRKISVLATYKQGKCIYAKR